MTETLRKKFSSSIFTSQTVVKYCLMQEYLSARNARDSKSTNFWIHLSGTLSYFCHLLSNDFMKSFLEIGLYVEKGNARECNPKRLIPS